MAKQLERGLQKTHGDERMNYRITELMKYDRRTLAIMLDENLTLLDNIANQLGAGFLMQFVGEEE